MDKLVNQKRVTKQGKNKKKQQQQPLKVVYITNPVKFQTSASEFRALVQELTGQDANIPESSEYAADNGVGAAEKVVGEGYSVHALEEETQVGHYTMMNSSPISGDHQEVQKGWDPSVSGSSTSYEDVFYTPEMVDKFRGLVAWHDAAHLDGV